MHLWIQTLNLHYNNLWITNYSAIIYLIFFCIYDLCIYLLPYLTYPCLLFINYYYCCLFIIFAYSDRHLSINCWKIGALVCEWSSEYIAIFVSRTRFDFVDVLSFRILLNDISTLWSISIVSSLFESINFTVKLLLLLSIAIVTSKFSGSLYQVIRT